MTTPNLTSSQSKRGQVMLLFFFNDTATTEIYTLSLHDALPISLPHFEPQGAPFAADVRPSGHNRMAVAHRRRARRSEEHTSELQSQSNLVCRLLLEKKQESSCSIRTAPA